MSEVLDITSDAEIHYAHDELPSLTDLASDLNYLLSGTHNNQYRVSEALEYAGYLKERYDPGFYSLSSYEYQTEQVRSRLYLDAFVMNARTDEFEVLSRKLGSRGATKSLPQLSSLISSKIDFQRDISDYVLLNPDKSSKAIFGNLVQMIHHSRRLLFNDEATFEKTKTQNLDRLRGILAEYKVLVAVSEEWPKATIGTVEQDILGADIIIPDVSGGKRPVALQVKSSNGTNRDLEFIPRESRAPIVRVPMNITEHDPLSLSREHISRLHSYVKTAPRFRIAWAA